MINDYALLYKLLPDWPSYSALLGDYLESTEKRLKASFAMAKTQG